MPVEEQENKLPDYTDLDYAKFEIKLGTGELPTMKHILLCFETERWVKKENREWTRKVKADITNAKNVLMRRIISSQIRNHKRFTISTPFDNTCNQCKGAGETYKFFRRLQKIDCMKCKGKPNNPKCRTCRGTRKVTYEAITDKILDTTPCIRCRGNGFLPSKVRHNAVINGDTGKKLKRELLETNLGTKIKSAEIGPKIDGHGNRLPPMIVDDIQDEAVGEGSLHKIKQKGAD